MAGASQFLDVDAENDPAGPARERRAPAQRSLFIKSTATLPTNNRIVQKMRCGQGWHGLVSAVDRVLVPDSLEKVFLLILSQPPTP
jgi:hypothetical protein